MALKGNKYGTHRVIEPKGVLTQAAYRIDNNMDVGTQRQQVRHPSRHRAQGRAHPGGL